MVANTVILSLFPQEVSPATSSSCANANFNALRILEDMTYQASDRQVLVNFVDELSSELENSSNLAPDLEFYQKFSFKLLSAHFDTIATQYNLSLKLESIYYPWNRTFEIGLVSSYL